MKYPKNLLFLPFLLLTLSAQAQVNWGVSLGGLTSFISGQNNYGYPELDYNRKFGFGAGFSVGYQISSTTHLGVELNYLLVGQDYTGTINEVPHFKEEDLYYFQLPLVLKRTIASKETSNIYVQGGVFVSFLRKAEIVWLRDDEVVVSFADFHNFEGLNPNAAEIIAQYGGSDNPTAYKDFFKNTALGALISIGKEWTAKEKTHFFLELRSGVTFTDVNAKAYQYDSPTGAYRPSRPIYVGFRFGWNFKVS